MKKIMIAVCLLCAAAPWAMAETDSIKEAPKDVHKSEDKATGYQIILDKFFALAKDQQMPQASEELFKDVLVSKSPDIGSKGYFDEVQAKLTNLPKIVGECRTYSRMFERMVAGRFLYIDYLVIFDKQPVEFSFQFYKPKDKWMLYGFSMDMDIVKKMDDKIRSKMLISDKR